MKAGSNRTIEDRLEDIEKEVHQVKMMLTEFLGSQSKIGIDDESALMNVKNVAKFLKVEVAVVYAACNKGEIPFLKVGKLYKFKKADVLKWLEKDKNNKLIDVEEYVNKYLQKNTLKG
jgi:excisionase family DNA binding protein